MRTSMILSLLLCALLLAAALPLAGQSPALNERSQFRFPPDHMACPVDLRADRRAGVISREVDGKTIPTGQGLILHFRTPSETASTSQENAATPRRVISADITVHGYTGRVIAQPVTAGAKPLTVGAQSELTEDFHLTGSAANPLTQKAVWTAKIHGITWIELTRVTFSDGSSWQRTIPSECRIEPSLFVLVK